MISTEDFWDPVTYLANQFQFLAFSTQLSLNLSNATESRIPLRHLHQHSKNVDRPARFFRPRKFWLTTSATPSALAERFIPFQPNFLPCNRNLPQLPLSFHHRTGLWLTWASRCFFFVSLGKHSSSVSPTACPAGTISFGTHPRIK